MLFVFDISVMYQYGPNYILMTTYSVATFPQPIQNVIEIQTGALEMKYSEFKAWIFHYSFVSHTLCR